MRIHNEQNKLFKDSVHGYIEIPVKFVERFIDTEMFQRLRHIEQTGMRTLYPSARHDRFIHSIGVFHLGVKTFEYLDTNIRKNEKTKIYQATSKTQDRVKFWNKCEILFLIACLLHDCGHTPFSHSFEFLYDEEIDSDKKIPRINAKLFKLVPDIEKDFNTPVKSKSSPHERMSALVVDKYYRCGIKGLLKDLDLYDDHELDRDIEFICRMIIGCKYQDITSEDKQIKNCLISLLNSTSIDVDSLDYIIRDAKLSGIDNMSIDIKRLLSALNIVDTTILIGHKFENQEFATCIKGKLTEISSKEKVKIQGTHNGPFFYPTGAGKEEKSSNNFNVPVDLGFTSMTVDRPMYFDGTLTGIFTGTIFGTLTEDTVELKNGRFLLDRGYPSYEIAYDKSALSVIENVLLARNYEYKWAYQHHKIVYYANYLLIELYIQCVKYFTPEEKKWKELFSWENMIDGGVFKLNNYQFLHPTDSDILFLFKQCLIQCTEDKDPELYKLLNEFKTRKYRKSLWKSYAECRTLIGLSDEEINKFMTQISGLESVNQQYKNIREDWKTELERYGMKDVIWVKAHSKMKALDPDNTYILFHNKTYTYRMVGYENPKESEQNFFYIYYRENGTELKREQIKNFIIQKLKDLPKPEKGSTT